MTGAAAIYRGLPADERQEFRLPALLKEHLARAASQSGQSLAEYVTAALAEHVTRDLASHLEWTLTLEEQAVLLSTLAGATGPSERARAVAERAAFLFGPVDLEGER